MVDSTVLVERLVAADDERKRWRLENARLQVALEQAEKDAVSLRGSCAALGEDLRQARVRANAGQRALSWIMHNRLVAIDGMPPWLIRHLTGLLKIEQKPIQ